MHFLALAIMLLIVNLAVPEPLAAADAAGCGGSIAAVDHCPVPSADLSRNTQVERSVPSCVNTILPEPAALQSFEPGQSALAFAETAKPVTTLTHGPPRRPPRLVS